MGTHHHYELLTSSCLREKLELWTEVWRTCWYAFSWALPPGIRCLYSLWQPNYKVSCRTAGVVLLTYGFP